MINERQYQTALALQVRVNQLLREFNGARPVDEPMNCAFNVRGIMDEPSDNVDRFAKQWAENIYRAIISASQGSGQEAQYAMLPLRLHNLESHYEEMTISGTDKKRIATRMRFLIGAPGMRWVGRSMAGTSPTNEELKMKENWEPI